MEFHKFAHPPAVTSIYLHIRKAAAVPGVQGMDGKKSNQKLWGKMKNRKAKKQDERIQAQIN